MIDELEKELKACMEGLPQLIKAYAEEKKGGGGDGEEILLRFIQMKHLNSNLAVELQKSRERNASEKEKTDQLKLKIANLEYKKSHLVQEIETCKSLATPNLSTLEAEMGIALAATDDAKLDDLPALHDKAMASIEKESKLRLQDEEKYEQLNKTYETAYARYDRKRKFLEQDIPTKLEAVKEILGEVSLGFDKYHQQHDKELANDEAEMPDGEEDEDEEDEDEEEVEGEGEKGEGEGSAPVDDEGAEGRAGRSKSVASMAES